MARQKNDALIRPPFIVYLQQSGYYGVSGKNWHMLGSYRYREDAEYLAQLLSLGHKAIRLKDKEKKEKAKTNRILKGWRKA
jgi:hypothetical protein